MTADAVFMFGLCEYAFFQGLPRQHGDRGFPTYEWCTAISCGFAGVKGPVPPDTVDDPGMVWDELYPYVATKLPVPPNGIRGPTLRGTSAR